MSGWGNIVEKEEELDTSIPEAPAPYKEPDTKTVVVDLASEADKPKAYVQKEGEDKIFQKRKEEGFSTAPPVDIYEPGFRSDMYDAIMNYFRKQKQMRQKHAALKEKMGWRS